MKIHPFIFSNNLNYRLSRHAVFWLLWMLYYATVSTLLMYEKWGVAKSFCVAFVEQVGSTPLDMAFCYFIIYFLFPKFLYKGRYVGMLALWLLASLVFIILYELNSKFIVPHIRGWFGIQVSTSYTTRMYIYDFFVLFSQINMEGCIAASIKLGKLWYIKQQEIDLLKQEKQKFDTDAEQGLIQPIFLTDLLSRMEVVANEKPFVAAQSMKKISHLLLYILYESKSPKVLLEKEIELLHEYVDLEKITAQKNINTNIHSSGLPGPETITPFIILPLVENAFKQLSSYSLANPALNINVSCQNEIFEMKLNWSKPIETSSLSNGRNIILQNISRRLQLIYPQSHELKMRINTDKIFVDLKINLRKAIN